MFLNGTSVVYMLWISSCVKVQIHSTLQFCIHMTNQAPPPPMNSSASPDGGHTQSPSPSSGSRLVVAPHCSQHPPQISKVLHLLLPCQKNKNKQTNKSFCLMLNSRRTESSHSLGFSSSIPFSELQSPLEAPEKPWSGHGQARAVLHPVPSSSGHPSPRLRSQRLGYLSPLLPIGLSPGV